MSPSPKKVQAIRDCQAPTWAKEVRSLHGMVNFTSRYIRDYSTLIQPLRELTKQDVPWQWGDKEQRVLDSLKKALTCETTMTHFDLCLKLETEIYVDASPCGLLVRWNSYSTGHQWSVTHHHRPRNKVFANRKGSPCSPVGHYSFSPLHLRESICGSHLPKKHWFLSTINQTLNPRPESRNGS